ncbi:biotin carboxylase N-terminal domain-containing protein [Sorangium sp. So ce448]|uniref:biotin carboxylase N-terminal domain-containing protein n=1 Tax=Sorangium sp. So ce448 TaxID=3133314 RepID=UPI003F61B427
MHEAGLRGIAVRSDAGGDNLHVRLASASYAIGPAPVAESYLRFDRSRRVTRRSGASAIHTRVRKTASSRKHASGPRRVPRRRGGVATRRDTSQRAPSATRRGRPRQVVTGRNRS